MSIINYNEQLNYKNIPQDSIIKSYVHIYPLEVRMQNPEIPQSVLVVCNQLEDDDITSNTKNYDYNIYSGEKIKVDDSTFISFINQNMKIVCNVLIQFMDAGYHLYNDKDEENIYNHSRIDDWIINFEFPLLKMFKFYFDIKTSCEDVMFVDEFLDNPQFRYMITDIMMKVIANYAVNNNITEETGNDWFKTSTYKTISSKLI